MQKLYIEKIKEDLYSDENFDLISCRIKVATTLQDSLKFYHFTQSCTGTGVWLMDDENTSLIIKVPKNRDPIGFIQEFVEFNTNHRFYAHFIE